MNMTVASAVALTALITCLMVVGESIHFPLVIAMLASYLIGFSQFEATRPIAVLMSADGDCAFRRPFPLSTGNRTAACRETPAGLVALAGGRAFREL
jgi:hypothetical protein